MQAASPSFPIVWTPDGCVVVGGRAAPAFAERKQARIFTGPFFSSKDRSSSNALQAWNEIANSMAPQAGVAEPSVSSSLLSTASSAFSSARTKFGRENVTVHMHSFYERAYRIAEQSSHDALHTTALDGALGLTEAFFACKGDTCCDVAAAIIFPFFFKFSVFTGQFSFNLLLLRCHRFIATA